MIIRIENIEKVTIEKLRKLKEEEMEFKKTVYNQLIQDAQKEYDTSVDDTYKKNPFLRKNVSDMTDDEKDMLCEMLAERDNSFLFYLGGARGYEEEIKKIIAEAKDMYLSYTAEALEQEKQEKMFPRKATEEYADFKEELDKEIPNRYIFAIDKSIINTPNFEKLKQAAELALKDGKQPIIIIDKQMAKTSNDSSIDYIYNPDEMNKLIELNNHLSDMGMKNQIRICEFVQINKSSDLTYTWNLNDVIKANNSIDTIVNFIKGNNLSPFEAMLYIHAFITSNFEYKDSAKMSHEERGEQNIYEQCRVLPGIFKNKTIVCSGYASLVKAIVDRLDMDGLKCDLIDCKLYKKSLFGSIQGGHCQNLITIKDEKYDINGHYIEDATWDSKNKDYPKGRGFAHCLYPVSDVQHMNNMIYIQEFKDNRLDTLVIDTQGVKKTRIERFFDKFKKPQIVEKYAEKSTPISEEKYKKGITKVYQLAKKVVDNPELLEGIVDQKMKDSSTRAKEIFDKHATSAFAKSTLTKRKKVKASLAKNDGRDKDE